MVKKMLINRYIIGATVILGLLALALVIGTMFMDGENPLSMGMTIWYLHDSGRDILRVANETERYLLVYQEDWKGRLAANLNSIEGISGAPGVSWILEGEQDHRIIFSQENTQNRAEVGYHYYLDNYIIVSYSAVSK